MCEKNSRNLPKGLKLSYHVGMNDLENKAHASVAGTSSRGFTLVEVLIVLALIGVVAGLAMSNLGELFGGGQEQAAGMGQLQGEAYVTVISPGSGVAKTLADLKNPPNGIAPFVKRDSDLHDPRGECVYKSRGRLPPVSISRPLPPTGRCSGIGTAIDLTFPANDHKASLYAG